MTFILRNSHVARVSVSRHIRSLATPAATSGSSAALKETFKDTLEQGPSLDDFIAGGDTPERVVLGNTKTYVTLLYSRENNNGLTSTLEVALACLPI